MADLEKVIKAAEDYEPYAMALTNLTVNSGLFLNMLAMLKKQKAKSMTEYDDGWDCPRCGLKLIGKTASGYPCDELDLPSDEIVKYCPVCGQAVKLDEID